LKDQSIRCQQANAEYASEPVDEADEDAKPRTVTLKGKRKVVSKENPLNKGRKGSRCQSHLI
jgi:hypothetical protein